MQKILVTGGLGFIGSNLIKMLLGKGYKVLNIDKINYASNFYNTKNFKINKNYKFVNCDIINKTKLSSIVLKYKPTGIFHLAAETHVDRSIDNPGKFVNSNIVGTYNLLECLRFYKIKNKKFRLIHISTDEVYGDVLKGRSKENDSYNPSSPYAASKAASDHLVFSYFRTFNMPVIITNCSNNYGPRQHPEKLIPKLIFNILVNKSLPIYGKGKNSREWIYVEDHCDALIKIYQKGKIGEFYNIGSNINMNNIQICKSLLLAAKRKIKIGKNVKVKFVKDRPGHDLRYAINSNKTRNDIKWKPKMTFKEGIEKTFQWYLNNKKYYLMLNRKDITKRLGLFND
tara:strand:+ start:288 stop:1313 length:1026 start_codon:yes stop_codon:yes gene_type:complete